jgi:predicted TIM-barrel fold metal-dependent hydrolase
LEIENPNIEAELEYWKSQIFLDTASKAFDEQIPELLNFSDVKHVLFGSDIGWGNKMAVSTLEKSYSQLDKTHNLTEAQIADIFLGNAKRLFTQDKVAVDTKAQPPIVIKQYKSVDQTDKIKYHYHCMPQKVIEAMKSINPTLEIDNLIPWDEKQTLAWMQQNGYDKVILSLDCPLLWQMNSNDLGRILRVYNDEVAKISNRNKQRFGAYGSIDINSSSDAVTEMKYCIENLKLDGICISTNIFATSFDQLIDENVLKSLAELKIPVMLHPQDSTGIPLINDSYLDAVYFVAKSFYLGEFAKYFTDTKFILTHTGGVLPYLANPINILYYMSIKKPKIMGYMIDTFIRHNPKGYKILMNMVVD